MPVLGGFSEAPGDRSRAGAGTYAGLFMISLCTLMYEVLLTRIFSVTMWYRFAFVAISVALFGMTIGALFVYLSPERFPDERAKERLSLFAVFGFLTPLAVDRFDSATTPTRIVTATAMLVPIGFLMGMPFPIGMKMASARPGAPTAFLWGINGATSVCASVLAVSIALSWGISSAFWAGCLSYVVGLAALASVARTWKA